MPEIRQQNEMERARPAKAMHASSWIFHDTPVRQEIHSALAKGLTLAEVPGYFNKNSPNLRTPSAGDLRKYLLHILLQDEEENGPDEADEPSDAPQTPPEQIEKEISSPKTFSFLSRYVQYY